MTVLELTSHEIGAIDDLLTRALAEVGTNRTSELVAEARLLSDRLPVRVRRAFHDFKLRETAEVLSIRGYPIDQLAIGPTPLAIPSSQQKSVATKEELLHFILAARLGEIFTWSSIQNGNIVNEIVPIKAHEFKLMSSGSRVELGLHTEDAFHPLAGEYLALLCIRNPSGDALTTVAVSELELEPAVCETLFEPRFKIGVNVAHETHDATTLSPILFGDRAHPYIRINLNNSSAPPEDAEAVAALAALTKELRAKIRRHALEPGEFVYIDNLRAVHGRDAYAPRFDGTDRWLKRLYITNDIRRSRAWRDGAEARVIRVERTQY